jgi:hypothetical protein
MYICIYISFTEKNVCGDCETDVFATTRNSCYLGLRCQAIKFAILKHFRILPLITAFSSTYVNSLKDFKNCCLYVASFLPLVCLTHIIECKAYIHFQHVNRKLNFKSKFAVLFLSNSFGTLEHSRNRKYVNGTSVCDPKLQ